MSDGGTSPAQCRRPVMSSTGVRHCALLAGVVERQQVADVGVGLRASAAGVGGSLLLEFADIGLGPAAFGRCCAPSCWTKIRPNLDVDSLHDYVPRTSPISR